MMILTVGMICSLPLFCVSDFFIAFTGTEALGSSLAACNFNALPIDKCIGNFCPDFLEITPRGLSRNPHSYCSLFLFKTFNIDQAYQFNLFGMKRYHRLRTIRAAPRLVTPGFGASGNHPLHPGPATAMTGFFRDYRSFIHCQSTSGKFLIFLFDLLV
jgi:hypothetical protein